MPKIDLRVYRRVNGNDEITGKKNSDAYLGRTNYFRNEKSFSEWSILD